MVADSASENESACSDNDKADDADTSGNGDVGNDDDAGPDAEEFLQEVRVIRFLFLLQLFNRQSRCHR
jgi:hypothetical protein